MVRLTSSEYCPSEIGSIARLGAGDYIWSAHDINRFGLSADGDRSILSGTENGPQSIWFVGPCCSYAYTKLQVDGKFVVRDGIRILWESQTNSLGVADTMITL